MSQRWCAPWRGFHSLWVKFEQSEDSQSFKVRILTSGGVPIEKPLARNSEIPTPGSNPKSKLAPKWLNATSLRLMRVKEAKHCCALLCVFTHCTNTFLWKHFFFYYKWKHIFHEFFLWGMSQCLKKKKILSCQTSCAKANLVWSIALVWGLSQSGVTITWALLLLLPDRKMSQPTSQLRQPQLPSLDVVAITTLFCQLAKQFYCQQLRASYWNVVARSLRWAGPTKSSA